MRLALLLPLVLACSGALEGELVPDRVEDWSFVAGADDVELATEAGRRFRTVAAGPLVHEGELYLHVSTIFQLDDAALDEVLAGGGVRLATGGRVYPLAARHLTEPVEIERVLPTLVRENLEVEATGIRWDPEPERYPGTQVRQWFFRLESAPE